MANDTEVLNEILNELKNINNTLSGVGGLSNSISAVGKNYYIPIRKTLILQPRKSTNNLLDKATGTDGFVKFFIMGSNSSSLVANIEVKTRNPRSGTFSITGSFADYNLAHVPANNTGLPYISTYDTVNDVYVIASTPSYLGLEYTGRTSSPITIILENTTANPIVVSFVALLYAVE